RCPARLRVIDSSLANPRSLAKDGSAHSGRTGGPTRRFPGLTGSTFAPACRLVVHLHQLGDAEALHAVEEVALHLLDGRHLEHVARDVARRGVGDRADDALDDRDEERAHGEIVGAEAEEQPGAGRSRGPWPTY